MLAFCALGASLSGCGSFGASSPSARALAYVRLDDVIKHDPLFPQLSKMDDAIAMVSLVGVSSRVPRNAADVAQQSAQLRVQIAAARSRTQRIIDSKRREYAMRERAAVSAALAAAGVKSTDIAAALGNVSAAQVRAAQQQAGKDFSAYQQSVVAQSNSAARSIVRQLQAQATQKLQAKELQEEQRETNLSLKLSQQDAAQRLAIQTRLSMLALDAETRKRLQGQLDAMTSREQAALAAQRASDQKEYSAYRTQVALETNAAIRVQLAKINGDTRAKLVSRQNTVGAQLRSSLRGPQTLANVSPATRAQIAKIAQQIQQQYQSDVQSVIADYMVTSDALEAQYATLHGADAEAAAATQQETAILQQRRQALYQQIVQHVEDDARRLAQTKGFRVVFADVTAAPGGYDMTNDLITDIESEHE